MKLIINADDYGLSKGVNLGIIEAFRDGVVSSTTVMANTPAFDHGVLLYRDNPGLKTGVHLTLTFGPALVKNHKTLTDEKGNFHKQSIFLANLDIIDKDEVRREYEAQIQKVKDAGFIITHFDGHHHSQAWEPCREVFAELCSQYKVAARNNPEITDLLHDRGIPSTEVFTAEFYGDNATEEKLLEIVDKNANRDSLEIMCHPAYLDNVLQKATSYNMQRVVELEVLTKNSVKVYLKNQNIQLYGYDGLR